MNTTNDRSTIPQQVALTEWLPALYGLYKPPHELHAYWEERAPAGAVLALKAAVGEIERLRACLMAEPKLVESRHAIAAERAHWRAVLDGIVSMWERRAELFANDADCAANMRDRADIALRCVNRKRRLVEPPTADPT